MTASPTATFTYDNNGNTLSKSDSTGATQYAWDFENRLTSVTLPASGGTVSFKYDPFGRRTQKSSASGTTNFLYDGSNILEDVDAGGNLVGRYTDTEHIDEPLAMLRSGTTSFYNADGIGSITSLTGSSGAIAATYAFDSFGNQTASTGTLVNPFLYTAREFDPETNLYFYRARHLDPTLGRFLSEDANKDAVGGMNFYVYVRNNPARYVDPDGMSPWDWWDKLWDRLGLARKIWNKGNKEIDWTLCGVYYTTCLETGMGIKEDLAQALNSPDPVIYATAYATLQRQVGGSSAASVNVSACMQNENCRKALECSKKGLTNPLPFPVKF